MREINYKIKNIFKILLFVVVTFVFVFIIDYKISQPFAPIIEKRDFVENKEVIATVEIENGTLVFQ